MIFKKKRVVVLIKADLSSLRLIACKPTLAWIVDRLKMYRQIDDIVVLVPSASQRYLPIILYCRDTLLVKSLRSRNPISLETYYWVAKKVKADFVVTVDGTCPVIGAIDFDKMLRAVKKGNETYVIDSTFDKSPITIYSTKWLVDSYPWASDDGETVYFKSARRNEPVVLSSLSVEDNWFAMNKMLSDFYSRDLEYTFEIGYVIKWIIQEVVSKAIQGSLNISL